MKKKLRCPQCAQRSLWTHRLVKKRERVVMPVLDICFHRGAPHSVKDGVDGPGILRIPMNRADVSPVVFLCFVTHATIFLGTPPFAVSPVFLPNATS